MQKSEPITNLTFTIYDIKVYELRVGTTKLDISESNSKVDSISHYRELTEF